MAQNDRDRQNQNFRGHNRGAGQRPNRGGAPQQNADWVDEMPWSISHGPYRDYGWDQGESALPEFREPDIHVAPYERQQVSRWHRVDWNQEYGYGVEVEGPYAGVGPKNVQRPDQRIMEDVCDRLTQHGRIDARKINVQVNNGEVTLSGSVNDRSMKRMAENVADQVPGVKDVHNELHVENKQPGGMQRQYGRGQNRGNQSGMPGGGRGRVDRVGRSGVYPASGPYPDDNAPVQPPASWGQGDRGAAGYNDSGSSELNIPPEQNQNQENRQGNRQQNQQQNKQK